MYLLTLITEQTSILPNKQQRNEPMYLTKAEYMNRQFLFKLSITTFIIFNFLNVCYFYEDYGLSKMFFARSASALLFFFVVLYFSLKKKTWALFILYIYLLAGIIQYAAIFISLFV